jgi:hypothetical protein
MFIRGISMDELDIIQLPDGRRGTVVHVSSDHAMIIVEVGSELFDYEISKNGLKEISRMTVGQEDYTNRLVEGKEGSRLTVRISSMRSRT